MPSGTYTVWASAYDRTNNTRRSSNSTFNASAPPQVPSAPTNLTATAGDGQIALSWTASSGAASYTLKRSTTSGTGYETVAANHTGTGRSSAGAGE